MKKEMEEKYRIKLYVLILNILVAMKTNGGVVGETLCQLRCIWYAFSNQHDVYRKVFYESHFHSYTPI